MREVRIYRSPAWLKRHRERGQALRLRILSVDVQQGTTATVVAMPSNKRHGQPHPARLRLEWNGAHWRIVGKGFISAPPRR